MIFHIELETITGTTYIFDRNNNLHEVCVLKAVFSQYKVAPKHRNTEDYFAWTTGNGDPMHEVCIGIAREKEARGRSRHKNSSNRKSKKCWRKEPEHYKRGKFQTRPN